MPQISNPSPANINPSAANPNGAPIATPGCATRCAAAAIAAIIPQPPASAVIAM